MKENNGYILTNNTLTVIYNGKTYSMEKDSPLTNEAVKALNNNDYLKAVNLMDVKKNITNKFNELNIVGNQVYYNGKILHNVVVDRIIGFLKNDYSVEPLMNFLKKLLMNPSMRSLEQLYLFLEHKNLPIAEDGDFFAYKAITYDWMDKHSRTVNNKVGAKIPVFERNQVQDDPTIHCSYGYHVGSIDYVKSFGSLGDRTVIVKVNPANVVSVPTDNNCQKCRVTTYEVVSEYSGNLPDTFYSLPSNEEDEDDI